MKLTIELVPKQLWYANPRKAMGQKHWDTLRKQVYAQYGHRCGICGSDARLQCHERWTYDDEKHVQTLTGFIALCEWCHHVKHIGLAGILAEEGKLDYERVITHFCTVNECSREDFTQHHKQAFAEWRERNTHTWTADWGAYAHLMETATPASPQ